jgi:HSP20 family protein
MTKKNDTALIRRGNNALTRQTERREEYVTPAVDVFETGDSFIVRIDMPGALRDTLQVSVDSRALVVKGSAGLPHAEGAQLLFKEIARKSYYRKFLLTDGLESGRIKAEFEDGVLTVVIPKSDQLKAKEIRIM